ncbi:MAG: hypothetical protein JST87_05480 [Bacteroidetes bacterium]|nr:hypothetical protein [Bacteroidota bacterium]
MEFLQIIKQFQDKHPESHVGGSIGLWLHGIDLKRDLKKSDIDMTVKYPLIEKLSLDDLDVEDSSDTDDFVFRYRVYETGASSVYSRIDISVSTDRGYVIINKEGIDYRVSRKEDILFFKKKYADKGVKKHINDLLIIEGKEPLPDEQASDAYAEIDDLPF